MDPWLSDVKGSGKVRMEAQRARRTRYNAKQRVKKREIKVKVKAGEISKHL